MFTRKTPAECHGAGYSDQDLDWEEWDPSAGSFVHHMIAGSFAGIAEHTVMFPVDTIKTYVQCQHCSAPCVKSELLAPFTPFSAAARLIQEQGIRRLWRGVSTMLAACIPAHAGYFSALEYCKEKFGVNAPQHKILGAAGAGAVATLFHDTVMTPMDVIKQRLQLGYYQGIIHCATSIARTEGMHAFYLSLPITLFMNVPYGCVMVAANESLKKLIKPAGDYSLSTYMMAGSGAGALAAAATCPLDLIKTRLQTQVSIAAVDGSEGGRPFNQSVNEESGRASPSRNGALRQNPCSRSLGGSSSSNSKHSSSQTQCTGKAGNAIKTCRLTPIYTSALHLSSDASLRPSATLPSTQDVHDRHCGARQVHRTHVTSSDQVCMRAERMQLRYRGILDAARQIRAAEGYAGFFRGLMPRLMVHTPSVAISWTTYETVKKGLAEYWPRQQGPGD